jgi:hypothetical protein
LPQGVPTELRARAWLRVSGAEAAQRAAGDGFYAALLARPPTAEDTEAQRQIELDLPRTFGEHPWLRCAPARDALRRVLVAAARAAPAVGYAQSMNYVAAFALLTFRADEEAAFWLVRACLERLAAPHTYARDLEGLHVELRALAALLADKAPRVTDAMGRLGAETSLFATEWLLCLFTCSLPAEARARVCMCCCGGGAVQCARADASAPLPFSCASLCCADDGARVGRVLVRGRQGSDPHRHRARQGAWPATTHARACHSSLSLIPDVLWPLPYARPVR